MYKMGNARQLTMEICTNGAITLPHDYLCYVAINTKLKACVTFSSKVMFSVLLVYCLCNQNTKHNLTTERSKVMF